MAGHRGSARYYRKPYYEMAGHRGSARYYRKPYYETARHRGSARYYRKPEKGFRFVTIILRFLQLANLSPVFGEHSVIWDIRRSGWLKVEEHESIDG